MLPKCESVFILAVAAVTALLFTSQIQYAAAQHISLQSVQNGKYVRINVAPFGYLAATSSQISMSEKFFLTPLGNNRVALQSAHDGSYIRAGAGQGSFLAAGSPQIKAWETFQLFNLGGDRIALRSVVNGKYVRAGVGQQSFLAAVSSRVAAWETFKIVRSSVPVQTVTPPPLPQPIPPPVPSPPPPATSLSPQLQAILDAHNGYRAKHCVAPLTWSAAVAAAAQAWANTCPTTHGGGGGYGQNLFWGTAGAYGPQKVVDAWYNEFNSYNFSMPGFSLQTGHFTQVIWKGSKELGCGFAACGGLDYWVCNYSPPGNYQDQFPQNVPPKCQP